MRAKTVNRLYSVGIAGLLLASAALILPMGETRAADDATPAVASEVALPDDFRGRFVHLGSWFVPEGDASGFHDVYADPDAVAAYRKTGVFPDGATLVKELRAHQTGNYTTGANVARAERGAAGVKQWFVMVKDAQNRHAARPEWGDGWGWGLFKKDDPGTNVVTDYRADCLGCHVPAKQTDWIYVDAYPSLDRP